MNWEPSRADHAIDRASASIVLPGLQPDAFDDLIVSARKAGQVFGLVDRVEFIEPIEVTPSAEGVGRLRIGLDARPLGIMPRRVVFRRLDGAGIPTQELSVGQQAIIVTNYSYRRWADFFDLITKLLAAINADCPATAIVRSARLEYLDRFNATAENADHFEVLQRDSLFLAGGLRDKQFALHTHSGWFDFESPTVRQLTNVNIDVADADIASQPAARRRISVFTFSQVEALSGEVLDRAVERLAFLHDHLKAILRNIVTSEAAERISLNKE